MRASEEQIKTAILEKSNEELDECCRSPCGAVHGGGRGLCAGSRQDTAGGPDRTA